MKLKLTFLAGAAVGYVLGARAGRGRYEEIKNQAETLWQDPRVQEKVTAATETAKDAAGTATDKAKETAGAATDKAKDKAKETVSAATTKAKDTADKVKDTASGSEGGDSLIGEEPGSDYEPKETKVQSS